MRNWLFWRLCQDRTHNYSKKGHLRLAPWKPKLHRRQQSLSVYTSARRHASMHDAASSSTYTRNTNIKLACIVHAGSTGRCARMPARMLARMLGAPAHAHVLACLHVWTGSSRQTMLLGRVPAGTSRLLWHPPSHLLPELQGRAAGRPQLPALTQHPASRWNDGSIRPVLL